MKEKLAFSLFISYTLKKENYGIIIHRGKIKNR
jgi:hypothetical protein